VVLLQHHLADVLRWCKPREGWACGACGKTSLQFSSLSLFIRHAACTCDALQDPTLCFDPLLVTFHGETVHCASGQNKLSGTLSCSDSTVTVLLHKQKGDEDDGPAIRLSLSNFALVAGVSSQRDLLKVIKLTSGTSLAQALIREQKRIASKRARDNDSDDGESSVPNLRRERVRESVPSPAPRAKRSSAQVATQALNAQAAAVQKPFVAKGVYYALNDETPKSIGLKLPCEPREIVSLNRKRYSGISLQSRLKPGTELLIPIACPAEFQKEGQKSLEELEAEEEEDEDDVEVVSSGEDEGNWVCCERCEEWRLCPDGFDPTELPALWFCGMHPLPETCCNVPQPNKEQEQGLAESSKRKRQEDAEEVARARVRLALAVSSAPAQQFDEEQVSTLAALHSEGHAECGEGVVLPPLPAACGLLPPLDAPRRGLDIYGGGMLPGVSSPLGGPSLQLPLPGGGPFSQSLSPGSNVRSPEWYRRQEQASLMQQVATSMANSIGSSSASLAAAVRDAWASQLPSHHHQHP